MSRSSGFCTPSTISLLRAIYFFHYIVLLVCWLLSNGPSGHRTTEALVAAGVSGSLDGWPFHCFFSRAWWNLDRLGLAVAGLLMPRVGSRCLVISRRPFWPGRYWTPSSPALALVSPSASCSTSDDVVRDVVRGLPKNLVFFGAIRISAARYAPLTAPWGVRLKGNSLYGLRLDSYSFVPGGYFFSKRNAPPVTA